jgi:hypothetical protein
MLQHAPYVTPVIVRGAIVCCGVRGLVKMVGMSDAKIPWPIGQRDGKQALIVYKGLARALKSESAEAVSAWWGVRVSVVKSWQRQLNEHEDAPRRTEGKKRKGFRQRDAEHQMMAMLLVDDGARKVGRPLLERPKPKRPAATGVGKRSGRQQLAPPLMSRLLSDATLAR